MKFLYLVLDGMGDIPNKELKGKTVSEAAHTPNMDEIAKKGVCGLCYPIGPGYAPESDQGVLSLLGYDVFKTYTGRGPLEAFGSGVKVKKNDIVFRANFARGEGRLVKDVRTEWLNLKKARDLVTTLNRKIKKIGDVKVKFVLTKGYADIYYRGVLILSGKGLSPKVTNTHPGYKVERAFVSSAQRLAGRRLGKRTCRPRTLAARKTARIINEYTHLAEEVLKNHKVNRLRANLDLPRANTILVRGAGVGLPKLKKLSGRWLSITDMPVEIAIAKLVGMKVIPMPAKLKDVLAKIKTAFKRNDFIYTQLKAPDVPSHTGDLYGKMREIEKIDKQLIGPLMHAMPDLAICVTADHSTPVSYRSHSAHPVPVAVYAKDMGADSVEKFGERFFKQGKLGTFRGKDLLVRIGLKS